MLMKLAERVAARDMEAIALADFGIEQPTITNLADEPGKSREKLSFELMALWRNEAPNHTKKVINHSRNQFLFLSPQIRSHILYS